MNRRRLPALRLTVLAAMLTAFGCADGAPSSAQTPAVPATAQPDLVDIPHPDADAFKPEIKAAIAPARAAFESARGRATGVALGEAHGKLGLVYQAHQQQQAAAACFINAQRLAPDDYRWPYHLAVLREETGDFDAAEQLYTDTLARSPGD
ncbi:MAG: hypothetical protein AAFU65_18290, partial [Pseudomonadota bacterium]